MKRFLKWTALTLSAAAGATIVYRWGNATRARLERGLERIESVTEEAHSAVAHTEKALGETAQGVREVRQTLG